VRVRRACARCRILGVVVGVVALSCALAPSAGALSPGELVQTGCVVSGDDPPAGCVVEASAPLADLNRVAISPDGRSVYAGSQSNDTIAIFDRDAGSGALSYRGCVNDEGSGGCANARRLDGPSSLAVSPDGQSVYASVAGAGGIVVFDRAADGSLSQKAGSAGCIVSTTAEGCGQTSVLGQAQWVTVSPDGASVYAVGIAQDTLQVFARSEDGTLLAKQCLRPAGGAGCTSAAALDDPRAVVVSHDNRSVYVSSGLDASGSQAVATFARATDPDTGLLSQDGMTVVQRCIAATSDLGCAEGRALSAPIGLALSPDDATLYVASAVGVATLQRDHETGFLTQFPGAAGCVSQGSQEGCATGRALAGARPLAVSVDGSRVYVPVSVSGAIAQLDRDAGDGTLTQPADASGCLVDQGSAPVEACDNSGVGLGQARHIAVSPDGKHAYAVSGGSALTTFDIAEPGDDGGGGSDPGNGGSEPGDGSGPGDGPGGGSGPGDGGSGPGDGSGPGGGSGPGNGPGGGGSGPGGGGSGPGDGGSDPGAGSTPGGGSGDKSGETGAGNGTTGSSAGATSAGGAPLPGGSDGPGDESGRLLPGGPQAPAIGGRPTARVRGVALTGRVRADRRGRFRLVLRCAGPASARCTGTVRVVVTERPARKPRRNRRRSSRRRAMTVTVASARVAVRGGARRVVRLRLNRAGRTRLARTRRLAATTVITVGAGDERHTTRRALVVRRANR
jgi:hypothetical protein